MCFPELNRFRNSTSNSAVLQSVCDVPAEIYLLRIRLFHLWLASLQLKDIEQQVKELLVMREKNQEKECLLRQQLLASPVFAAEECLERLRLINVLQYGTTEIILTDEYEMDPLFDQSHQNQVSLEVRSGMCAGSWAVCIYAG